jgi:hypothetical protein
MTAMGHERRFDHLSITSGLPKQTDIVGSGQYVARCQKATWIKYPAVVTSRARPSYVSH